VGNYADATTTAANLLVGGTSLNAASLGLLSACITLAENEIDSYITRRYDVSSFRTTVPPLIRSLTQQLGVANFHFHNSKGGKESISRSKELRDPVMKTLTMIREGTAHLLDTAGSLIPVSTTNSPGVLCNTVDYTPTFAEDNPKLWKVDRNKLDDIADERD
jgi:hypothetical protein